MPEKLIPSESEKSASKSEKRARTKNPRELEVGQKIPGEQEGQELKIVAINKEPRQWLFKLEDAETSQPAGILSENVVERRLKKALKKPESQPTPSPAPEPSDASEQPTPEEQPDKKPKKKRARKSAEAQGESEAPEESKLAKTIDPRELKLGDEITGKDGERFAIKTINFNPGEKTWSCEFQDLDTNEVTLASEARVKRLLEAQNPELVPPAPETEEAKVEEPATPEPPDIKTDEKLSVGNLHEKARDWAKKLGESMSEINKSTAICLSTMPPYRVNSLFH